MCAFSLDEWHPRQHNAHMADPTTDNQSFSGFAALNRADRTHEPVKRGVPSMAKFVMAAVILAVAVFLFIR